MVQYKDKIKEIWLKSAVVGSLWASFEIIVGSFFHNIKFPLAGTILTIIGVTLMISFGVIWKDKGLFWRAGLICALMKSVSPSAVLIGPMTGIFAEAVLLELVLLIVGRNFIGYMLAGITALYSVILHKIITLLILYGFNIVKITENLYYFTTKQLHIPNLSFYKAFFLLSCFYIILGILASIIGYFLGKKVISLKQKTSSKDKIKLNFSKNLTETNETKKYSLFLLFFHFFLIIAGMVLMNFVSLWISAIFTVVYVTLCIIYYKRALRYLKKPMVWLQIVSLTLISAIFFNGFESGHIFQMSGFLAGLEMSLRAMLIMFGFSAISTELRNPIVKIILYRKGFRQLYKALGLAFSALPYLMKNSASPRVILKKPLNAIINNLLMADTLLQKFVENASKRKIYIISGDVGSGKTTFMKNLSNAMQKKGLEPAGFIAEGKYENNKRSEYNLINLQTGDTQQICSTSKNNTQTFKQGAFYFNNQGIEFGEEILSPENIINEKIIFIDEVGPFELRGKGWSDAIEKLFKYSNIPQIWSVRERLTKEILKRFDVTEALIFDIKKDSLDTVIKEVSK